MRKKFISEFKENEHVEDVFYVGEKTVGVGKTGKPYISLKVSDKSGIMDAKIWDKVDTLNPLFDKEEFILAKGNIQSYQSTLQMVITDIKKVANPEEVEMDDFMPESGKDINAMWNEFLTLGKTVKDKSLSALFSKIFIEDADVQEKFKFYPAAKSLHHSYKGGLLEHSLNVARLADFVCRLYGNIINRDIMIFSALAHDMGKIWELTFSLSVNYTDEGKLLGHIMLADEIIIKKAAAIPKFPAKTLTLLRHALISHHGEYEFGSPKRPKTREALVIHFLDNLDAKLNGFVLAVDKDMQGGDWTSIVKSFERQLYKGKLSPDETETVPAENKKEKEFNPVLKNFGFELFKDKG
jgi:3'-5' exoribonuclease